MKQDVFPAGAHVRASRAERAATLLRLWRTRPELLGAILRISGAPSKLRHPRRWFDLASRMLRPICCISWDVEEKVARIVDHHTVTQALGGILAPSWEAPRKLMDLTELGPQYSLKIDEADWMTGDGLTTISLWHGIDRMFTIGFLLSRNVEGITAYVGGLQGRSGEEVLALYRDMTKDAKGTRPRDLMVELHRMFCRAIGVTHILAVTQRSRSWNDRFADEHPPHIPSLDYDEAWTERGGERISLDWFALPVETRRRAVDDIPSRKRALYRQRYAMLDEIERDLVDAVSRLVPGSSRPHGMPVETARAPSPPELQPLA